MSNNSKIVFNYDSKNIKPQPKPEYKPETKPEFKDIKYNKPKSEFIPKPEYKPETKPEFKNIKDIKPKSEYKFESKFEYKPLEYKPKSESKSEFKDIKDTKPKEKFITKQRPCDLNPGYWINSFKTTDQIVDNESILKNTPLISKEKSQIILTDKLNPNNLNISYSESNLNCSKRDQLNEYIPNKDLGAGRGFGNLSVSSDIRNGNYSRLETKFFREKKEEQQLFDYTFQYLDKDFQNPKNVVMPIPRGGESTRKLNNINELTFDY